MVGQNLNSRKVRNRRRYFLKLVILMSLVLCPDTLYPEIFRELVIVIMQPWLTISENNFMNRKSTAFIKNQNCQTNLTSRNLLLKLRTKVCIFFSFNIILEQFTSIPH